MQQNQSNKVGWCLVTTQKFGSAAINSLVHQPLAKLREVPCEMFVKVTEDLSHIIFWW